MIRGALALALVMLPAGAGPLEQKHTCPKMCQAGEYVVVEREKFGEILAERDAMIEALKAQERELERLRPIVWNRIL